METSGHFNTLAALHPRERAPGIHWIGDWVGPKANLNAVAKRKKSLPQPGIESRSSSP